MPDDTKIAFHVLTQVEYLRVRFENIVKVEGSEPQPYLDTSYIPTIGYGFNLRAHFDIIARTIEPDLSEQQLRELQNIVNGDWKDKKSSELVSAIDAKMESFRLENPKIDPSFRFSSSSQLRKVFDVLAPEFEKRIDIKFTSIPTSTERVALFTLGYGNQNLLGSGLVGAIENNNRAEAWYEIRYNSNAARKDKKTGKPIPIDCARTEVESEQEVCGTAKRRYFESDVFGLYNDVSNVTEVEARQIAEMYAHHRAGELGIDAYDERFGQLVGNAIRDYTAPYVYRRQKSFLPTLDKLKVLYPESKGVWEALADAVEGPQAISVAADEPPTLAGDAANELILGKNEGSVLEGNAGDDVVIGGRSNDILRGGFGDDTLRGGDGDDRLEGGPGFDRYRHLDSQTPKAGEQLTNKPGKDTIAKDADGVVEIRERAASFDIKSVEGDFYPHPAGGGYVEVRHSGYIDTPTIVRSSILLRPVGESGLEISNNQAADVNQAALPDTVNSITVEQFASGDLNINLLSAACRDAGTSFGRTNEIVSSYVGTCGSDNIRSNLADNATIDAKEGNDYISGGSIVYGGSGNDSMDSKDGDQYIDGGPGRDYILSGIGIDTIYGGPGDDSISDADLGYLYALPPGRFNELHGGEGNDTIQGSSGKYKIYGEKGDDLISFQGLDVIYISPSETILDGGEGNDRIEVRNAPATLIGGPGINEYLLLEVNLQQGMSYVIKDAASSPEDRVFIQQKIGGTIPLEQWVAERKSGKYAYDATSKTLHVQANAASVQGIGTAQTPGEIVIENFTHNGIFRIENVPGAPPAPWQIPVPDLEEPGAPSVPGQYQQLLPVVMRRVAASDRSTDAMLHPVSQQHPEQVAYIAHLGVAAGAVMGVGAMHRTALQRFLRPVYRRLAATRANLDVLRIRAEQRLKES